MLKLIFISTLIIVLHMVCFGRFEAAAEEGKISVSPVICDSTYPRRVSSAEECQQIGGEFGFMGSIGIPICEVTDPKIAKALENLKEGIKQKMEVFLHLLPIKFKDWKYPKCSIYLDLDEELKEYHLEAIRNSGNFHSGLLRQGEATIEGDIYENLNYYWALNNNILKISRSSKNSHCKINFIIGLNTEGELLIDGKKFDGTLIHKK